jgi:hypothetical protein
MERFYAQEEKVRDRKLIIGRPPSDLKGDPHGSEVCVCPDNAVAARIADLLNAAERPKAVTNDPYFNVAVELGITREEAKRRLQGDGYKPRFGAA